MLQQNRNTRVEIKGNALRGAFDTFILSRKAMRCSPATIIFYQYMVHPFLIWAEDQFNISKPFQINNNIVRAYLADLSNRSKSDWTVNDHARAIRTMLRFWYAEGTIPQLVKFQMPRIRRKKMSVLSRDELFKLIQECKTPRDKALILFLADSGLRRAELIAFNWGDLNLEKGICKVNSGKGGKSRIAVIGQITRQAIIDYRRTLANSRNLDPLIQTENGSRFTNDGLRQVFRRLSKRTGLNVTPHTLRRTFVKLSLRSKMDPLHLKDLLGHSSLDMVLYYAGEFDEEELIEAYNGHSPIENLIRAYISI